MTYTVWRVTFYEVNPKTGRPFWCWFEVPFGSMEELEKAFHEKLLVRGFKLWSEPLEPGVLVVQRTEETIISRNSVAMIEVPDKRFVRPEKENDNE